MNIVVCLKQVPDTTEVKIEAAKHLVYKAACKKQAGEPYSLDAARAKLFAADVAMEVTTKAVQIFGGYGYTREYPVERMMRDAKITEIYEGTSEVQKMVIAGSILRQEEFYNEYSSLCKTSSRYCSSKD